MTTTPAPGTANLSLEDLDVVSVLGTGSFSKVSLAVDRATERTFALKAMNKDFIQENEQQERVILERAALLHCDSPFVVGCVKSFVDDARVYLLTQFLQGGDLGCRVHRRDDDGLPEGDAKFYAALTVLGLDYLHGLGYAHRDIRPENIMLDVDGYSKIIDLGFAKLVGNRTFTLCGQCDYLAPELVSGLGHNRAVDMWSFGVTVYEMMTGRLPFTAEDGDPHQTMINISKGAVDFPGAFPTDARRLVRDLMHPRPQARLGMGAHGWQDVINHEWFRDVDFKALESRRVEAPWVPRLSGPLDVSQVCQYAVHGDFECATPLAASWEWSFRM